MLGTVDGHHIIRRDIHLCGGRFLVENQPLRRRRGDLKFRSRRFLVKDQARIGRIVLHGNGLGWLLRCRLVKLQAHIRRHFRKNFEQIGIDMLVGGDGRGGRFDRRRGIVRVGNKMPFLGRFAGQRERGGCRDNGLLGRFPSQMRRGRKRRVVGHDLLGDRRQGPEGFQVGISIGRVAPMAEERHRLVDHLIAGRLCRHARVRANFAGIGRRFSGRRLDAGHGFGNIVRIDDRRGFGRSPDFANFGRGLHDGIRRLDGERRGFVGGELMLVRRGRGCSMARILNTGRLNRRCRNEA
jgi:hypothetical protein